MLCCAMLATFLCLKFHQNLKSLKRSPKHSDRTQLMSLSTMTVWVYMVRWGPRTVLMLPSPLLHHSPREEKTDVDRKQFLFEQVTCKFILHWPEQGLVTREIGNVTSTRETPCKGGTLFHGIRGSGLGRGTSCSPPSPFSNSEVIWQMAMALMSLEAVHPVQMSHVHHCSTVASAGCLKYPKHIIVRNGSLILAVLSVLSLCCTVHLTVPSWCSCHLEGR